LKTDRFPQTRVEVLLLTVRGRHQSPLNIVRDGRDRTYYSAAKAECPGVPALMQVRGGKTLQT